jgi:hypothetical protein
LIPFPVPVSRLRPSGLSAPQIALIPTVPVSRYGLLLCVSTAGGTGCRCSRYPSQAALCRRTRPPRNAVPHPAKGFRALWKPRPTVETSALPIGCPIDQRGEILSPSGLPSTRPAQPGMRQRSGVGWTAKAGGLGCAVVKEATAWPARRKTMQTGAPRKSRFS